MTFAKKVSSIGTVDLNVAGLTNSEEVHARLAAAFSFPDYYGANWDAFWDCVSTLDPIPQKIEIHGMESLSVNLPRDATILKKCLSDLQTRPEGTSIIIEFI